MTRSSLRHVNLRRLRQIAETEFADIVVDVWIPDVNTMRIMLRDDSFIDVWYSLKLSNRYSYHWERQAIDGTIYRHDNAPHYRWQAVSTFPNHFHDGSEMQVTESHISAMPEDGLRVGRDLTSARPVPRPTLAAPLL